jgi:hypothetical protein
MWESESLIESLVKEIRNIKIDPDYTTYIIDKKSMIKGSIPGTWITEKFIFSRGFGPGGVGISGARITDFAIDMITRYKIPIYVSLYEDFPSAVLKLFGSKNEGEFIENLRNYVVWVKKTVEVR